MKITLLPWFFCAFVLAETALAQSPANIEAPVYKAGDYWKFKITTVQERADSSTRTNAPEGVVTIKYTGNAFTVEGYNYPFDVLCGFVPTVRGAATDIQWLQFPLHTGKKWSYRYIEGQGEVKHRGTFNVDVSVVSEETRTVAAGTLPSLQISGAAVHSTRGFRRTSAYHYSALTKSVISGRVVSIYGTRHEIELLEYGTQ